jgi:DNA-binding SARP family transcriptional activator
MTITITTLGPVRVLADGAPAPPELVWRKNLALLVYLARSPRRTRSRDHLVALLWPEKDAAAARHSLN